jgi:hypothetical protein
VTTGKIAASKLSQVVLGMAAVKPQRDMYQQKTKSMKSPRRSTQPGQAPRRREYRIPDSIRFLVRPHAPVTGNAGRFVSSPPLHKGERRDRDSCRSLASDEIPLRRGCALSGCLRFPRESVPRVPEQLRIALTCERISRRSPSSRVASAPAVFRSLFWGAKRLFVNQWSPQSHSAA